MRCNCETNPGPVRRLAVVASCLAALLTGTAVAAAPPPPPLSANCLSPEQQAQYRSRVAEVMREPSADADAIKRVKQRYREARGRSDNAQAAYDQCRKGGGACAAEQKALGDLRAELKAIDAEQQKVLGETGAPAAGRINAIRAEYPPCR